MAAVPHAHHVLRFQVRGLRAADPGQLPEVLGRAVDAQGEAGAGQTLAPQTVTLDVPGMTCAACPITVKKAISKVDGVSKVDVSYEKRQAVVTFDDAKTSVEALTQASENAGYPASLKE